MDHRRVVESFYDTCPTPAPVVIFQEGCYNHCIRESPAPQFSEISYNAITARVKDAFEARDPSSRFYTLIPPSYQEPGWPQRSNAASTAKTLISRTTIPDDATVLYIGGETLALTNLLMTHGSKKVCIWRSPRTVHLTSGQVYRFDSKTEDCKLESWRTNKLLMKRYHAVLHAKDAGVFGILIGTLGVGGSLCPYRDTPFAKMCNKPHTFLLYLTYELS